MGRLRRCVELRGKTRGELGAGRGAVRRADVDDDLGFVRDAGQRELKFVKLRRQTQNALRRCVVLKDLIWGGDVEDLLWLDGGVVWLFRWSDAYYGRGVSDHCEIARCDAM